MELTLSKRMQRLKDDLSFLQEEVHWGEKKALYSEIMEQESLKSHPIKLAEALAHFLNKKKIFLSEYDLLAGHLRPNDDSYSRALTRDEEIDSCYTILESSLNSETYLNMKNILEPFREGVDEGLFVRSPAGHVVAGYDRVLKFGFEEFIKKAKTVSSKGDFRITAEIVAEAAVNYCLRYANKAGELLLETENEENRKNLSRIADSCYWISKNPPRNFFDAVQLLWLTHEIIGFEQISGSLSLGRVDQLLYPFYEVDLAEGIINKEEAEEIIDALWIKLNGCRRAYQNVVIGGIDENSEYIYNDITLMCLHSTRKVKMDQPLLSVRWHPSMPVDFWNEVQLSIEDGLGFPALFNDSVVISSKLRMGLSEKDANNYGIIGCVEPCALGKEYSHTEGLRINWAKILEKILKDSQSLDGITSFDLFLSRFKSELIQHALDGIKAVNLLDKAYPLQWPSAFLSTTMEGCIEKNLDVTAGGTIYNNSTINSCAMTDTVDSLMIIKKMIFEEQLMSLKDFASIINSDFSGHETLRKRCAGFYPKFGNDVDEVDLLLADLMTQFTQAVEACSNPRGGRYQVGMYTVTAHAVMGKKTGSLPNGRPGGISLANGMSPAHGAEMEGPTAVINSITKINHSQFGNGMVLDMKFHPAFFAKSGNRPVFHSLIETYFNSGGMEIQFNVIDRKTLIEAQREPEKHKNLVVRVSGFSAYFIDLDVCLQDEIIMRTEFV
jgi:pyruvate formate-lyase/glycerol dehydratase family glycyl radical enzyme